MSEKLIEALNNHFENHRIVFWYDQGGIYSGVYEAYTVPDEGIKLRIDNNEFELRYRMLKDHGDKKILAYSPDARPEDRKNWLLDLNLSNFMFLSNEAALILQELQLGDEFLAVIQENIDFFRNKNERYNPLKRIIQPDDEDPSSFRTAMLSVLCGGNRLGFPEIALKVMLAPSLLKDMVKYKLDGFFWVCCKDELGYEHDEPTVEGLMFRILTTALNFQLGKDTTPGARAVYTHLDTWRKHQDYREDVRSLLDYGEQSLNAAYEISNAASPEELADVDIFKEADRKIFIMLLEQLLSGKADERRALRIIEKRRETYWYRSGISEKLVFHYRTLYHYLRFREQMKAFDPRFASPSEGWDAYTSSFFRLDAEYRRFLYAVSQSEASSTFSPLLDKLEGEYTEVYLQQLASRWQKALDADPGMADLRPRGMGSFFRVYIEPYLAKDRSVFVIVSDGLRYEIGAELAEVVGQKNRFEVELLSQCAPVPSYTPLGMASLLPHKTLGVSDDGNTVLADGISTAGLKNRERVIQGYLDRRYPGKKARAVKADIFMDMPRSEQADLIRGIDLVFLYSPGVDAVGDDVKTELRLPKAADDEIKRLTNLCTHIGNNLSRTHILITADHGFLYRYREIPETERAKIEAGKDEVRRDHRFILARQPVPHTAADIIDSEDQGRSDPFKIQLARGVTRFRRSGGGTRYVHGGRMPQELIVPLLIIRRTRTDDVSGVNVVVLDRQNRITTGQVTVTFLQEQPVEAKRPARTLEAVFEGQDGTEISDKLQLIFDSEDSGDQNRSRKVTFHFSRAADDYNNTMILLKLYELKSGGVRSFYREYSYHFQKKLQMDVDF